MGISFHDLKNTTIASAVVTEPTTSLRSRKSVSNQRLYRRIGKRVLDVALILAAAPVVVPVVGVLALGVALDGGRPFYVQDRVGLNGRTFRMWKLRSMVVDADERMERHLASDPEAKAEWERNQKLQQDPRITPFGRFLRRSSLDELPQLWNVLKGDMSLVGPRPMMPCQRKLYPGTAYYNLRPGVTGYWQIADRHRTTFEARADFDAAYDADLSLRTDADVLLKTFSVVLRGTGC
jgi:lipopolysaccharide/colanic/teichoic acid biosynthesis glycosyltransferase